MDESENIKAITDFLFIEDDIGKLIKSDLLVILCNNNLKGIAKLFDDLYKSNIIDDSTTTVISGNRGSLDDFEGKECDNVFNILVNEYGYNSSMFILENKATNIYENLLFSKEKIGDFSRYNNILIMSASFALRRVKMCASKLAYPLDKIHYIGTVNKEGRNCAKDNWWKSEEAKIRVYQEIERIGKYLIKGDLDIK